MIVLDTHALLWVLAGSPRLGRRAARLVERALTTDTLWTSAITFWEVRLLVLRGRLTLAMAPGRVPGPRSGLRHHRACHLGEVAVAAAGLTGSFGDPADCFIAATGRRHDAKVMTADARLLASDVVETIDARVMPSLTHDDIVAALARERDLRVRLRAVDAEVHRARERAVPRMARGRARRRGRARHHPAAAQRRAVQGRSPRARAVRRRDGRRGHEQLRAIRSDYEQNNPTCWGRIAEASAQPFSTLILTTAPLDADEYRSLTAEPGRLYHLDGFHRLIGWSLANRLTTGTRVRAFVAQ